MENFGWALYDLFCYGWFDFTRWDRLPYYFLISKNHANLTRFGGFFCARKKCIQPLDKKFWRPRASSSTTTICLWVPRAIISAKLKFVKSFLRVWTKFFAIRMVFWCRRANYTVVERRCQVLFTGKVQIFQKPSLGAAPIIQYPVEIVKYFLRE